MGASSAIKAGGAYVEITTRDSKLVKGLASASKKLSSFGKSVSLAGAKLGAVGAAIEAPLTAAVLIFANMGDSLDEMAQRTGASVEALSELGFAADLGGAGMEGLETGIRKMQKTIGDAAGGSKQAAEKLAELGVPLEKLQGLAPEDQFKLFADALSKIEDPGARAAAAMQIFGKSGTALLPMMEGGAAGLEEMQQKARELGLTFSGEDAKGAAALSDGLDILKAQGKAAAAQIGAALAPAVTELATRASAMIAKAIAWIKENRALVVTVAKVALVISAAGAALVLLGGLFIAAGAAISGALTVLGLVGSAVSAIAGAIAFLVSPIGLAIAAIVGLAAYFLYTSDAIGAATESITGTIESLLSTTQTVFGGMMDAVRAGDIGLAAAIGWAGLKVIWSQGLAWVMDKWEGLRGFLLDGWTRLNEGIASLVIDFWAGLQSAFVSGRSTIVGIVIGMAQLVVSALGTLPQSVLDFLGINVGSMKNTLTNMASGNTTAAAKEQAAIEKDRKGAQGTLGEMTNQEINRRGDARQKRTDARQANVDAAQTDLDALRSQAEFKAAAAAANAPTTKKTAPTMGKLPELQQVLGAGKVASQGTFDASAVAGLAAGSAADRTATATEKTAKNTEKILKGGAVAFT